MLGRVVIGIAIKPFGMISKNVGFIADCKHSRLSTSEVAWCRPGLYPVVLVLVGIMTGAVCCVCSAAIYSRGSSRLN